MSTYSFSKKVNLDFDSAVNKTKEELKKQGFGILTEIDVKETIKNKLNKDFDNYLILGACNPPLAYQALTLEKEIGLLLPCNVIIYEDNKNVFVAAIKPTVAMSVVENEDLQKVATEVDTKLADVINNI